MNRSAATIIAALEERDLLELATRFATAAHVSLEEMLVSRSHERAICGARHAFWAALHVAPYSFSHRTIAKLVGVERTTILMGIKKDKERAELDDGLGSVYDERLKGLEARVDDLERLSVRLDRALEESTRDLAKANERSELLEGRLMVIEQRRAS